MSLSTMEELNEDQVLEDFESQMNSLDIGTIRMDRQRAQRLKAALDSSGKAELEL